MKNALPLLVWLLFVLLEGPTGFYAAWEYALILFQVLILVPLCLQLLSFPSRIWQLVPLGSVAVAFGLRHYTGESAAWLAAPYVLWALGTAGFTILETIRNVDFSLKNLLRVFAIGFWATGALWLLLALAGARPLGFDAGIVSLTAAHFHAAGMVLTTVIFQMVQSVPGKLSRLLGYSALAGMPVVAGGIVGTRLGYPWQTEWIGASLFAIMAVAVAVSHMFLKGPARAQVYWRAGGSCLILGAILALLYANRFVYPISWIHLPNMKWFHGTLNTVGFGWLVLRGWTISFALSQPSAP